jgi:SRSO17 transposase
MDVCKELRMTPAQILSLGPQLANFLGEFDDCFARSEPRGHLARYVKGQLSDLKRKSIQPIADLDGTPRRTLQEFLDWSPWKHGDVRDRVQQLVVRDHADPQAIGIIDDSGHPKSGKKTACIQRQWCGNTGKIDNCVVTVHLSYVSFDTRFRTMLDTDLFLPENGWDDPARRQEAGIPDEVVYRPKYDIALDQLRRALANGVHFGWLTFDEWYTSCPNFLHGLETLGQRFVGEIRRNFHGWLCDPRGQTRAGYRDVETLCRYSPAMMRQPWQRFHIKDTEKGPSVWEVKCAPFWLRRDDQVLGPYWLICARNVLDPTEEKYFLCNAEPGTPLPVILHVAFGRWPVERTLEDEKDELGMSHFEVRKYDAILRHLAVTQVSHLLLARQAERLRGEKPGDHRVPGADSGRPLDRCTTPATAAPQRATGTNFSPPDRRSATEGSGSPLPHSDANNAPPRTRNQPSRTSLLHTKIEVK